MAKDDQVAPDASIVYGVIRGGKWEEDVYLEPSNR